MAIIRVDRRSAYLQRFGDTLAAHAPENLRWKKPAIPDSDHSSIPLLNWYHGLLCVFDGYDMSHYGMMEDPDAKKAMKVIHMGLKYHPKSPYLHEKLGAAYEMTGDTGKALESYQDAFHLNPQNKGAEEKIQQLKK